MVVDLGIDKQLHALEIAELPVNVAIPSGRPLLVAPGEVVVIGEVVVVEGLVVLGEVVGLEEASRRSFAACDEGAAAWAAVGDAAGTTEGIGAVDPGIQSVG